MATAVKPEILLPRVERGSRVFGDESLNWLSHLLDDFIKVPGLPIRFGLDGIAGVFPGIGDWMGGVASCFILIAAWWRGVSYATIARMMANVGIEVAIGAIPVVGDAFDIAWRANRRNYALLTGSICTPRRYTIRSWIFLIVLCAVLMAVVLVPVFLLAWLMHGALHAAFGANPPLHTWI